MSIDDYMIYWSQYRKRFIEEMMDNPKSIELIHWLSKFENNSNNNNKNTTLFASVKTKRTAIEV